MASPPPARIGWPLLPLPDETGRLYWPTLAESIEQQIRVVLQTRVGEQLMRPGFGAGLQDYVGQPDSQALRRQLQERVTEALERWEPRIALDGTDVFDDPAQRGLLRVEIRFRIKRTGAPERLGITLALENS